MAPSEVQPASESIGGQPEEQRPDETSEEALGAHASQTKLESVSTHGPAGVAPSTVQPASESVGGQPEGQRLGDTPGEAFDAHLQTKPELGSTLDSVGGTQSAAQPAFQSIDGETQRPEEASGEAFDAHAQQTILAQIDSASADQATLRYYLRDPDPIIGAAAFDALGVRNKRAAVEALLDVVNDPTEPVRLQALQLVLNSSDLDEATWVATLRAALADPDPAFAASAMQTLGGLKIDAAADDPTFRYHLRDADPAVGAAAFDALGVRNKEAAVEALLDVVNDPAEPARLQALQLLLGSPEAGEATLAATLRTALADPDSAIVACAVQELGGRDDAEAISALAEALGAGDLPTRLLIVQSIASNTSAVPLLHQGLEDPDETVRTAATAVLFPSEKTKD
jgi:HEAT repeat protein